MRTSLSIIISFALVSLALADEEIGLCCLCDSCGPPLSGREMLAIDSQGTTCQQLVIDMADPTNSIQQGNQMCRQLKSQWYNHCCNPSHIPSQIAQAPTVSAGVNYPSGPYPSCDLCINGQYPSQDLTMVAVLDYPNVNTCKELYWWAKQGNFEDRLCKPIQNYFSGPCGCESSGSSNSGGTNYDQGTVNSNPGGTNYNQGVINNNPGGTNSNYDYNIGGGAPDQNLGNINQGTSVGEPYKKYTPEETKDTKLFTETDRGTIRRTKRRLKGSA